MAIQQFKPEPTERQREFHNFVNRVFIVWIGFLLLVLGFYLWTATHVVPMVTPNGGF